MKKIFILIISIALTMSVHSFAEGKVLGDSLYEKKLDIPIEDKRVEMLVSEIVVLPDDNNFNRDSAISMIERISQIDPTILTFLAVNDLKIKLFDGKLTDEPTFTNLKGVVPRGWTNGLTWDDVPGGCGATLAVAKIGASQTGMGHSSINLELHELGHLFERNYQELKDSEEYAKIWKEEAPKLMPNRQYFLDYQDEFFAEAFAMYYLGNDSRELVKQNAPKTYRMLSAIESKQFLA